MNDRNEAQQKKERIEPTDAQLKAALRGYEMCEQNGYTNLDLLLYAAVEGALNA